MAKIVVCGSANLDYVVPVKRLPKPGETVLGGNLTTAFGGKGANQAVAASRLGGEVEFIGKLGLDAAGEQYQEHLRGEGIGISGLLREADCPSGCAMIFVDEQGENVIVVAPGSNACLLAEDVDKAARLVAEADLLLVQLEIPGESVRRAVRLANENGTRVLFNPSPASAEFLFEDLIVDYLVLNTVEACMLTGECDTDQASLERAARLLAARGAGHVVLTRGAEATLVLAPEGIGYVETFPVEPVDTVGAGDTFAGALAVALGEKRELIEAVRFANCAAALATTRMGAQTGMPSRSDVEVRLRLSGVDV